jgi:alpha-tubulin suppressor-like RCC1 family protein
MQDGTVYSFGCNDHGELGLGPRCPAAVWAPHRVEALRGVTVVSASAGQKQSYFVGKDGTVYSCGDSSGGMLGRTMPVPVTGTGGGVLGGVSVEARAKHLVCLRASESTPQAVAAPTLSLSLTDV